MENSSAEELLPLYFQGKLNPGEEEKVEQWRNLSEENRQVFADSLKAWEGMEHLRRMKSYNSEKAIQDVNARIKKRTRFSAWQVFQRAAAILILPFIIATLYFALENTGKKESFVVWQTLEIPAGMRSEIYLPDSTKVYLNSKTTLSYPLVFSKNIREVRLSGEAYFEVAENKDIPFIVNTGRINIEVTGTEFLATNYAHEEISEVVLLEGGINLFQGNYSSSKKHITQLHPGEKATCRIDTKELVIDKVYPKKYVAWKNGILMFRDDPMPEVVRRLNRWYNVDIKLEGPKLKNWTYTATFEDESLVQVLELLKISAPIDFTIRQREIKNDKTFSKMEVIIRQR